MIDDAYCRTMAAYSAWQNGSLLRAADGLTSSERWQDRGAFFGSIAATLNHLLWDDALWLARLSGDEQPERNVPVSLLEPSDWNAFRSMRQERDRSLITWAERLKPEDLAGDVIFAPGGGSDNLPAAVDVRRPPLQPPDASPRSDPRHVDRSRSSTRCH